MREEESNWFSKWEDQLPSPEELTPLSQSLISRDLALAFDIQPTAAASHFLHRPLTHHFHHRIANSNPNPSPTPNPTSASDFDSSSADLGGGGSDEPARTLKRPRLVWTPQLHKRFVDAVAHLGIKNAVPKTIMQLMSVDGLTRENVASHLQKYRLYLKRMQGGGNNTSPGSGSGDAATDHLFASSPVPAHFLNPPAAPPGRAPNSDHFLVPAIHHQQQAAAAAMAAAGQYHHHHHHNRQLGHFGSPTAAGHPFLSRQSHMGGVRGSVQNSVSGYVQDLDSSGAPNGRKVLTLFPTGD